MPSRRLFFGMEVDAPWPTVYPEGRIIEIQNRHLTLAFLGSVKEERFQELLDTSSQLPISNLTLGSIGQFDQPLFFSHVVAWHVKLIHEEPLIDLQKKLLSFLKEKEFQVSENHRFKPHITIARTPYKKEKWEESFRALPLQVTHLHLYESMGKSCYEKRKTWQVTPLFEEISHTADIGYIIRGASLLDLYYSAATALAFIFPPFLQFFEGGEIEDFNALVSKLNQTLAYADIEIGCPFKAVSYHGDLLQKENYYEWEMIVDV